MKNIDVKNSFISGDEWLYYKFYCGYKSSDKFLSEVIKPISEQLLQKGIIDKWFYIRYSDPDLHLRIRFHYNDKNNVGIIINLVNDRISHFVKSRIISKVMQDTYDREIQRYGVNTIELSEILFSNESTMMVNLLHFLSDKGDLSEHIRWKFGLKGIDQLLNDFQFDLNEKFELITKLRDGFNKELNIEKYSKKLLNDTYRERRKEIENILNDENTFEFSGIFNDLLKYRSQSNAPLINKILDLEKKKLFQLSKHDYLASLSHMFLNRLFRSNQRQQEMVLYNYLWKYYDSFIARSKYKNNKPKEKKVKTAITA